VYPNLFLIGAAKSGTTSLHYYLDQHPEVHMSQEKEPNYFSHLVDPTMPGYAVTEPDKYQALFDSPLPVRGEASVSYSFWPYPAGVPQAIHAVAPDAKFLYLVRDPVERVISHYRHRVGLGTETRSLREVVETPRESVERYVTVSSYATQLEQYLKVFPLDRLLVLDHADLQRDREAVLRECFAFLGVDKAFRSPLWAKRINETARQRRYSPLANRIRFSAAYRKTLGWSRPALRQALVSPLRRVLTSDLPEHADVDDDIRGHFAALLEPEARRLRQLTGRTFSTWSV
jgi:hypothetical protein